MSGELSGVLLALTLGPMSIPIALCGLACAETRCVIRPVLLSAGFVSFKYIRCLGFPATHTACSLHGDVLHPHGSATLFPSAQISSGPAWP